MSIEITLTKKDKIEIPCAHCGNLDISKKSMSFKYHNNILLLDIYCQKCTASTYVVITTNTIVVSKTEITYSENV